MNQEELRTKSTGRRVNKAERAFAIYACHQYSQASHKDIAVHFNLSHVGSVSHPLSRIRKEIQKGAWGKEIKWMEKQLYIVKRA